MRTAWRILAGVAVLAGLAALGAKLLSPGSPASGAAPARFEVAGEHLSLPAAYLRAHGDDGAIELAAFFPGFAPAGRYDDVRAATDLDRRLRRTIFLELRPADPRLDPAERTTRLYLRFLGAGAWTHPGGLIARAFEPGSPFEGDELFFVAPEGRAFAARCPKPNRGTENFCVAIFRSGGLDVTLRFAEELLADWTPLTDGARGLIETARRE